MLKQSHAPVAKACNCTQARLHSCSRDLAKERWCSGVLHAIGTFLGLVHAGFDRGIGIAEDVLEIFARNTATVVPHSESYQQILGRVRDRDLNGRQVRSRSVVLDCRPKSAACWLSVPLTSNTNR
jgi:hypothetical protein